MELAAFNLPTFLRSATREVFKTMLSMGLQEDTKSAGLFQDVSRIVGSVSLAGKVSGTVNIHVSDPFARLITSNMLGLDVDEVENQEEIHDVIGELSNMIGGDLKSRLCDAGFACNLSIPAITSGKDFNIEAKGWAVNERVIFKFEEHIALIEAFIKNGS